jgi:hypothetical protein
LGCGILPQVAAAQSMPPMSASTGIAADRFAPGVGPLVLLQGEGAEITPRGELAWALSLSYSRDTLRLTNQFLGDTFSRPVRAQLTADFAAEVGVWKRLAVAIGVPVVLYADGDRLRSTGIDESPLGAPAGGDMRVRVKATLVGDPARRGLHLAALLQLTFPGGGQSQFAATDGVTVEPRLLGDLRWGRLLVCVALGVRFAPERKLFATSFSDELTWLAGGAYRFFERGAFDASVVVEAAGAAGADSGTRPVELRGAARARYRNWSLDLAGAGGLTSDVGAPAWRVLAIVRGRFELAD